MTNISTTATEAAAVAEQGATNAPSKASSKKGTSQKKGAPRAKKNAKQAAPRKRAAATNKKASPAAVPREFSKKAIVLDLLRRKDGATMTEIIAKTDWQAHSVRGFISGTVNKKMALTVESTRDDDGTRRYRIAK
jgi:septal ring-binding cell division protein DamX